MIIVEGMDNSGKTTVVNQLASQFGLPTVHSPGPAPYQKLRDFIMETALARFEGRMFIYDRHPIISEHIYGPVLRGHDDLDMKWTRLIGSLNPLVIYCDPGIDMIMGNTRDQMPGVMENAEKLLEAYRHFINVTASGKLDRIIRYDYSLGSTRALFQTVRTYLENQSRW